jgi:hypothetical protein
MALDCTTTTERLVADVLINGSVGRNTERAGRKKRRGDREVEVEEWRR